MLLWFSWCSVGYSCTIWGSKQCSYVCKALYTLILANEQIANRGPSAFSINWLCGTSFWFLSHELLLPYLRRLHFLHFMASSRLVVIVLAINVCASSIPVVTWCCQCPWCGWHLLLGRGPRVVGALATCTVTLLEGLPLNAWFLGLQVPLNPEAGVTRAPPPVGHLGALGLQPQLPQPWGGSASPPLLFPWLHLPPSEKICSLSDVQYISDVLKCFFFFFLIEKKTLYLCMMLSTSCRLRGETNRVSSATIILTSPMTEFSPQAIRLKLGVPRGLSG